MIKKAFVLIMLLAFAIGIASAEYTNKEMVQSTMNRGYDEDRVSPDNTEMNKYNREENADMQKESRSDRKLTQMIRRAIVNDDTLSTYAHNVKIITRNGMVTLKGPVRTETEKKSIEMKAIKIAGEGNVRNELTIATD